LLKYVLVAQQDRVINPMTLDKGLHRLEPILVEGNTDNLRRRAGGELLELRNFTHARLAPGSPEIHDHHVALERFAVERSPIQRSEREVGRLVPNHNVFRI
jgi:hypothetical protein